MSKVTALVKFAGKTSKETVVFEVRDLNKGRDIARWQSENEVTFFEIISIRSN